MKQMCQLTGIIEREDDGFVASCPELDVVSQGDTIEQTRENLIEAVELFLECADESEIRAKLRNELYITPIEVSVG